MFKLCLVLVFIHGVRTQINFSSVPCNHRHPKIVGGLEAQKHELPFIVSLMRRGGHFCGASIINDRWILSAGHCVCNGLNKIMKPAQIQGVAGLHRISEYSNVEQALTLLLTFQKIVPHPQYECTHVKNDIALLELVDSIEFSLYVQPICLNNDLSSKNLDNELAIVSGWGWTEENQETGQRPDVLMKASVKMWNNNLCEKSYRANGRPNSFIADTQLCAGFPNGGVDSCWADSGGPLVSKENVLLGIVSTGIGCARPGLPGIYTRVSKYIPWLRAVIYES